MTQKQNRRFAVGGVGRAKQGDGDREAQTAFYKRGLGGSDAKHYSRHASFKL